MLAIVVAALLGMCVGSIATYVLTKRGAVVQTAPNHSSYFSGLLDGYDVAYAGLSIDLRCKAAPTSSPEQATHATLWAAVDTDRGTLYALAGTASAKGIKFEQDKIA